MSSIKDAYMAKLFIDNLEEILLDPDHVLYTGFVSMFENYEANPLLNTIISSMSDAEASIIFEDIINHIADSGEKNLNAIWTSLDYPGKLQSASLIPSPLAESSAHRFKM